MGFFNIESGPAAKFERPGDSVSGTIVAPYTEREATEIGSSRPKINSQGKPVMMAVVELQTNLREAPDDDGLRVLYVDKYAMRKAIAAAVRDAKVDDLEQGGILTVTFTHESPSDKGNPQKNFTAAYTRAAGGASTWDKPADAVAGAREVQRQVARTAPTTTPQAQPPAPAAPAQQAVNGVATTPDQDMAKIRELSGYGLGPAQIMAAFPDGRYTLNAITAILAIPA